MRLKSIDESYKLMYSYVLKCRSLLIIYLNVPFFFNNFVDFTLSLQCFVIDNYAFIIKLSNYLQEQSCANYGKLVMMLYC
jgi:hypothetical protein